MQTYNYSGNYSLLYGQIKEKYDDDLSSPNGEAFSLAKYLKNEFNNGFLNCFTNDEDTKRDIEPILLEYFYEINKVINGLEPYSNEIIEMIENKNNAYPDVLFTDKNFKSMDIFLDKIMYHILNQDND